MFPGQGSQYLGMLSELRRLLPVVDDTLKEADEILRDHFEQPLSSYFTAQGDAPESERFQRLSDTRVLQPAIVTCNEALRRVLVQFAEPALVFGHSLGECSAAIAAGVMSFSDGLKFAASRGAALSTASPDEPGMLLQVAASEQNLRAYLPSLGDGVVVANKNCARQTVLGGKAAAIREAEKVLRAAGLDCSVLPVSHAFHTELMRAAVEPLRDRLASMTLGPSSAAFLSGIDGESAPHNGEAHGWFSSRLSRQVVEPVDYLKLVRAAYARGARVFVEVGPKQAQCGFVGDILNGQPHRVVPTCHPKLGEFASLGRAIAALVAEGLVSYGGEAAASKVSPLRVAPRAPFVGRIAEDADTLAQSERATQPAPAAPPPAPASVHVPTANGATLSSWLDQVAEDPAFWQFFARQASTLASYVVGSYQALGGAQRFQTLSQGPSQPAAAAAPATAIASASVELFQGSLAPAVPATAHPAPAASAVAPAPAPLPSPRHSNRHDARSIAQAPADSGAPSDEWLLERTAAFLDYRVEELSLDAPLAPELGVDEDRQLELLRALEDALGFSSDAPPVCTASTTLRELTSHLRAPAASSSRPSPQPVQATQATQATQAVATSDARSALAATILNAVAQKTGYTLEELKLDAHLEYELGIDSISQIEILDQLQEELQLPVDQTFRVSDYPTLRSLIAYVETHTGAQAVPQTPKSDDEPRAKASHAEFAAPFYCRRLAFEPSPAPRGDAALGRTLVLHDGTAPLLVSELGGAELCLTTATLPSELAAALHRGVDTLIVLLESSHVGDTPLDAATSAVQSVYRTGLGLLQAETRWARLVVVVGAAATEGDGEPRLAHQAAAVAAWRSLARESGEGTETRPLRIIEVDGALDARVEAIAQEVRSNGPAELRITRNGERTTSVLRHFEHEARAPLNASSVVMVTGGARGIMARIARALFESTHCKLVLVGRTPALGDAQVEPQVDAASTRSPMSEQEATRRRAEAAATLDAFARANADVLYVQADLGLPGELSRALAAASERFGHVDVLVHGAGVDNSKALTTKSEHELIEVLRPKLTPLADLATLEKPPRLVAISSVSARFGNRGQLEYSAANEALARSVLRAGGLALDFGPWRDVGMAARLKNIMATRGIDLLECDVAARVAAQAIASWPNGEYVICGRLGRASQSALGEVAAIELDVPSSELVASYQLRLEDRTWLRDHSWQGSGLLPGVVSLAAFVDAARELEPSLCVTAIQNLDLLSPVLVRPGRSTRVQLSARRGNTDVQGVAITTELSVNERLAHRATVLLGGPVEAPRGPVLDDTEPGPSRDEIYSIFFHGESFRVLAETRVGASCAMATSHPLELPLGADLTKGARAATLARELALQAAGLFAAVSLREAVLPIGVARLKLYSPVRDGEVVSAFARYRGEDGEQKRFDVTLIGDDGRIIEELEGLVLRRMAALKSEASTAPQGVQLNA